MKWRKPYDTENDEKLGQALAYRETGTSRTQQQFAHDSDINVIVRRFRIGQTPLPPAISPDYYGVIEDHYDLGAMMRTVHDANRKFSKLPAELRARFHNSPAELWAWIQNAENHDEAVEIGLLTKIPNEVKLETPTTASAPAPEDKA